MLQTILIELLRSVAPQHSSRAFLLSMLIFLIVFAGFLKWHLHYRLGMRI